MEELYPGSDVYRGNPHNTEFYQMTLDCSDPTKTVGTTREFGLKAIAVKPRCRAKGPRPIGISCAVLGCLLVAAWLFYHTAS